MLSSESCDETKPLLCQLALQNTTTTRQFSIGCDWYASLLEDTESEEIPPAQIAPPGVDQVQNYLMKTPKEFIQRLKQLSKGAFKAALVIDFQNKDPEFLFEDDPDLLSKLNDLLQRGGKPAAVLRIDRRGEQLRPCVHVICEPKDLASLRASIDGVAAAMCAHSLLIGGGAQETPESSLTEDWQKALLFLALLSGVLPPWARGEDQWKALAALTGWPKGRCVAAFQEAGRRGMAEQEFPEDN